MGDREHRRVLAQARLDQMWADLRQYQEDIETIAEHGLPAPDDEGAVQRHRVLIEMMACVVAAELAVRGSG